MTFFVASLFVSPPTKGEESGHSRATESDGRWQTDQPGFRPDLSYPIFYTLTLQGASIAWLGSTDQDATGFTGPSWQNFTDAFTKGPRRDDDEWYWNYVLHPLAGSESYLRARAQGCTPAGSFLFSAAASTVWEFGFESWYQRPSAQDLIITPLAGSLIGELRFRAKRALLEADTTSSRVLVVAIDPIQSAAEIIGDVFGQDWREPAFQKSPLKTAQSRPLFSLGFASTQSRPAVTFRCHFTF